MALQEEIARVVEEIEEARTSLYADDSASLKSQILEELELFDSAMASAHALEDVGGRKRRTAVRASEMAKPESLRDALRSDKSLTSRSSTPPLTSSRTPPPAKTLRSSGALDRDWDWRLFNEELHAREILAEDGLERMTEAFEERSAECERLSQTVADEATGARELQAHAENDHTHLGRVESVAAQRTRDLEMTRKAEEAAVRRATQRLLPEQARSTDLLQRSRAQRHELDAEIRQTQVDVSYMSNKLVQERSEAAHVAELAAPRQILESIEWQDAASWSLSDCLVGTWREEDQCQQLEAEELKAEATLRLELASTREATCELSAEADTALAEGENTLQALAEDVEWRKALTAGAAGDEKSPRDEAAAALAKDVPTRDFKLRNVLLDDLATMHAALRAENDEWRQEMANVRDAARARVDADTESLAASTSQRSTSALQGRPRQRELLAQPVDRAWGEARAGTRGLSRALQAWDAVLGEPDDGEAGGQQRDEDGAVSFCLDLDNSAPYQWTRP